MKGEIRRCSICGNEFVTVKGNEKFCSAECREENAKILRYSYKYHPEPKSCVVCGKTFQPHTSRCLTCSPKCSEIWHHKNQDAKRAQEHKKEMIKQYGSWEAYERYYRQKAGKLSAERNRQKAKPEQLSFKFIYSGKCVVCGSPFETLNPAQRTCGKKCSKKLKYARMSNRIPKEQIIDKDITLEALYRRDSGVCYLCGKQCDWNDKRDNCVGDNYPSIDHIHPVSKGGLHSWKNVRLAHMKCNIEKSDAVLSNEGQYISVSPPPKRKNVCKMVGQYTKNGELIRTYASTAEAERLTCIKQKGIQNCARGETKSYKNYVWKYCA